MVIIFLTLFMKICGLEGEVPSASRNFSQDIDIVAEIRNIGS